MNAAGAASAGKGNALSPAEAAQRFWTKQLVPATHNAPDVREVIAALRSNATAARARFARTPAIGGPSYFLISGGGKVISNNSNEIGIELDGSTTPGKADVLISIGPLFGNAIRDGTGAFKAQDYANSSDFNALSSELNKHVKSDVFPALREKAMVGSHLRFAGVAELSADETSPLPLKLVPVLVEFK
jgi:predicted lipoprotein